MLMEYRRGRITQEYRRCGEDQQGEQLQGQERLTKRLGVDEVAEASDCGVVRRIVATSNSRFKAAFPEFSPISDEF